MEPPKYLTKKQSEKFNELAEELLALEIMSNLDCDALARYIQSVEKYLKYDKLVNQTLSKASGFEKAAFVVVILEECGDKYARNFLKGLAIKVRG